jgi:hypothetical protein
MERTSRLARRHNTPVCAYLPGTYADISRLIYSKHVHLQSSGLWFSAGIYFLFYISIVCGMTVNTMGKVPVNRRVYTGNRPENTWKLIRKTTGYRGKSDTDERPA